MIRVLSDIDVLATLRGRHQQALRDARVWSEQGNKPRAVLALAYAAYLRGAYKRAAPRYRNAIIIKPGSY
jgi:hypothetical protein